MAQPAAKPKSFAKRNRLIQIQEIIQKEWEEARLYEADAPAPDTKEYLEKNKYFGCFPYPYMNGALHLGHCFSLTKVEFAVRYEKLRGKNILFPFGFHCTGMPIKACADKLKHEIEKYGNPPDFSLRDVEVAKVNPTTPSGPVDSTVYRAKKVKTAQKSAKTQWEILLSNDIPATDIPKFVETDHWLQFFPRIALRDLQLMGLAVDWRRSFITTDVNPYYDSFVRWQFNTLKKLGKLEFGKRYAIYSPLDGQPCADHDRYSGEGVLPQEYTGIKMQVIEPCNCLKLKELLAAGRKVFFLAGTLRPETMYGQTNCWIKPDGRYGAFEAKDGEVFICTFRAARNLAYQGFSSVPEKVTCLVEFSGKELLGVALKAPLSPFSHVFVLPMKSIMADKSTGVVTCVPSDSPDDYINLELLRTSSERRAQLGVCDEWVLPFAPVPIISISDLGDMSAKLVCEQLKIKDPGQAKELEQAKEIVYRKGFYDGELIVGPHKGKKVSIAKTMVRDELIASGQAVSYSEPASLVISRSGDECVVALTDQWYLKYEESEWKKTVERIIRNMKTYHDSSTKILLSTLDWFEQWAVTRSYGLGTRLPWDDQYLIESLSDSTIYMAYYTVAHLLQGGGVDGSKPGPLAIHAAQLTDSVWDFVLLDGPAPDSDIPLDRLEKLRHEFRYWYPFDLRASGKDLLTNHLLFCLYNHATIFPPELAPRAFRANGFLLINSEKMAKSTGNFLTLHQAVEKFSADGMRMALADAGDALDDANFMSSTAENAILKLHTLVLLAEDLVKNLDEMSCDDLSNFHEKVFSSRIDEAILLSEKMYDRTMFREAVIHGFYNLQIALSTYLTACKAVGLQSNRNLILRFLEVQALLLAPVTPHVADYIWRKILKKSGFVFCAQWPVAGKPEDTIMRQSEYIERIVVNFRQKINDFMNPKKNKKIKPPIPHPNLARVIVATKCASWQTKVQAIVSDAYDMTKREFLLTTKQLADRVDADPDLKREKKKAMQFIALLKEQLVVCGDAALSLGFDEEALFREHALYLAQVLELREVAVVLLNEVDERIRPGTPGITFEV